jgi:hypothetical protein
MKTNSRMMVFFMTMVSGNVFCQTNLLPNGNFNDSQGIAGWTATQFSDISFASSTDADNSVGSGSLELVGRGSTANSTCFSVVAGAAYSFGGKLSLSAPVFGSFGKGQFSCNTFSDSSCTSSSANLGVLPGDGDNLQDGFNAVGPLTGTLRASDRFVQCTVSNIGFDDTNANPASAFVDDLYFDAGGSVPTLGGYLSGSWYDPNTSGQGFDLQFTAQANTLIATWFTYSPDGKSTQWVYGGGTYDPTMSTVTVPAVLTSGTSFSPNFVKANVTKTPWGNLTFAFTDCNNATLTWNSTLPGYGSGTEHLQRLTSIAGLSCPQ